MSKGGSSGNQTVTQKNLPDFAIPFAENQLAIGDNFTMNPDYRMSVLDRNYSNIRGVNQFGQPNSQVGNLGLAPQGLQQPTSRQEMFEMAKTNADYAKNMDLDRMFGGAEASQIRQNLGLSSRGGGRQGPPPSGLSEEGLREFYGQPPVPPAPRPSIQYPEAPFSYGTFDPSKTYTDAELRQMSMTPSGDFERDIFNNLKSYRDTVNRLNQQSGSGSPDSEVAEPEIPIADQLTPFQAFDRQRFADTSDLTDRGEQILGGRYDQRFGENGTGNPFDSAVTAANIGATYGSDFSTTVDPKTDRQSYTSFENMTNPDVFQSRTYSDQVRNFANPNAQMRNVNAGLMARGFGNANTGIQGAVEYQRPESFADQIRRFQDPFESQVVNQAAKDIERNRQIQSQQIASNAARQGSFGGSREALQQSELARNAMEQTADTIAKLRSAGFNRAADLAQNENLQRLGLTARDLAQVRGLDSQGRLQGQQLTARDLANVRGLQSQGALAAQGLQSQGALAAMAANRAMAGQGLGLDAQSDRQAQSLNAALLSQGRNLDQADLSQLRNIFSNESQFKENAARNAGALNLRGAGVLGDLTQRGLADEQTRINQMIQAGGASDARNQRDLDFIYDEFGRELDYPGRMIDLRNSAISPATGAITQTTQPRYRQNPLIPAAGAGLSTYAALAPFAATNPYAIPLALGAGSLGLLS